MDVEGHMVFGSRFEKELADRIVECDIVLVVIGPDWLRILQERQNDPDDYVRLEIEEALRNNRVVVPVVLEDASIPKPSQLPSSICELPKLHAIRLRSDSFSDDCKKLIKSILSTRGVSILGVDPKSFKKRLGFGILGFALVLGLSVYLTQGWILSCPPNMGVVADRCQKLPVECPEDKEIIPGTALCCYYGQKEEDGRCVGEPSAMADIITSFADAVIYVDGKKVGKGSVKDIKVVAFEKITIEAKRAGVHRKKEGIIKPGRTLFHLDLPSSNLDKRRLEDNEPKPKNNTGSSLANKKIALANIIPPVTEMVEVPSGDFFYGCNAKIDRQCFDNEKPGGKKSTGKYSIDKYEVTVEIYKPCVDAGRCTEPIVGGYCNWGTSKIKHPMNCITWKQAKTYCHWSNKDLPTEIEWEKAARATGRQKYPWGNENIDPDRLKFFANIVGSEDGYKYTSPVGSFEAGKSPYGAFDMVGNVWEWTKSPGIKNNSYWIRGGGWKASGDGFQEARVSVRKTKLGFLEDATVGFRCVKR